MNCSKTVSKTAKKLIRYVPEFVDIVNGDITLTDFVVDQAEEAIDDLAREKRNQKARRALSMRDMIKDEKNRRKKEQLVDKKHEVDMFAGLLYFDAYLGVFRVHASYPPYWIQPRHIILAPRIMISAYEGNSKYKITYSEDGDMRNVLVLDFKTRSILEYGDSRAKPKLPPLPDLKSAKSEDVNSSPQVPP